MGGTSSRRRAYDDGEYDRVLAARIAFHMMCCSWFHRRRVRQNQSQRARFLAHGSSHDGIDEKQELHGFTSEPPTQLRGLLLIGPEGTGKSSLLERAHSLTNDLGLRAPYETALPAIEATSGFSIRDVRHRSVNLRVWDLGGSEKIRPYWKAYLGQVHAVVYVVKAQAEMSHFRDADLNALLEFYYSSASARRLPLLVLVNITRTKDLGGNSTDKLCAQLYADLCARLEAELDESCLQRKAVFCVNASPQGTNDIGQGRALRAFLWNALDWVCEAAAPAAS